MAQLVEMGAHVRRENPIEEAALGGFAIVQLFLGDPQSWKGPQVEYPGGAEQLRQDAETAGLGLYVHAPYVLNVATTNNRIRIPSRKLLQQHVTTAAAIGARGVVVHGGHVNASDDPAVGFDNWRKCISGLDLAVPILIENTAGGANAMARHLDRLARLWDAVAAAPGAESVGFCLDTCHAHAGGIPPNGLVDAVRAITGRIDLVHLNDSRDPFDSGADRHEVLGRGFCDPDGLVAVAREAAAPVILETPGRTRDHAAQLAWLRARW